MSRIDQLSGRRANFGQSRSFSNIATKRRQEVNLQTIRIGGKSLRVSARTLKTLKRVAGLAAGTLLTKKQKKAKKTIERSTKKTSA